MGPSSINCWSLCHAKYVGKVRGLEVGLAFIGPVGSALRRMLRVSATIRLHCLPVGGNTTQESCQLASG